MGSCLSKKSSSSCSISSAVATPPPPSDPISQPKLEEQKKIPQAEETIKKEIFVIKQRKSYEKHPHPEEKDNNCPTNPKLEDSSSSAATVVVNNSSIVLTAPVRTSSCTKEEVDAILIQCGRLSRSSSGKAAASASVGGGGGGHKYSGSKRSYDFDNEYYYDASAENNNKKSCDDEEDDKYQQRHSRPSHRRTPSREKKDSDYKRSGSRDRSSSSSRDHQEERKRNNGSRRSSRSPARSETVSATATATATDKSRPGKMVSVPASVSTRDKNIESATTTTAIKRVSVKRSGEVGLRTAASPRSKSPAANARPSSNENSNHHQQVVVSLSRNSSRKAEHSPYRRNPMSEIDDNCVQIALKSQDHNISTNKAQKIKEPVQGITKKPFQKPDERKSRVEELPPNNNSQQETLVNCGATKQHQIVQEPIEAKALPIKNSEITTVVAGTENLRPSQTVTRSRSSRRSRDLDLTLGFNPDTLLNPTSYASLLLEDIHNFHQQNTTNTTTFSLPPCVTKACSILEAVADLNSCTSSINLPSSAFSGDASLEVVGQSNKKNNNTASSSAHHLGKRRSDAKDPFVESEVFVSNDLLEPSLHKYVTLRRGVVMGGGETEQQESSGSNSYVGQHWVSPSLQDPNSADSTERWTSRSNTGEEVVGYMEEPSLIGCQKQVFTDASACDAEVGVRKVRSIGNITALPSVPLSGKKREVDPHRRVGDRGGVMMPFAAAASM